MKNLQSDNDDIFNKVADMTKPENVLPNFKKAEMPGIDHTPAIASTDSGSYTFSPCRFYQAEEPKPEVKFMGLGDVLSEEKTEDEKPQVSLYNLLHHSTDDLHILGLAMISYQFKHFDTRDQNPELYAKITSWVNLVESAIKERQLIESEAWADKTAKEINEATK